MYSMPVVLILPTLGPYRPRRQSHWSPAAPACGTVSAGRRSRRGARRLLSSQWTGRRMRKSRVPSATGTAVMRATASQQLMVVTLRAPQRPGFYEVWLLARNGVSMISLGDLNADHTGTFSVPPGTDLRNYSRIDISLQPFNGSTLHSKTSVVRGSLPAAALGSVSAS